MEASSLGTTVQKIVERPGDGVSQALVIEGIELNNNEADNSGVPNGPQSFFTAAATEITHSTVPRRCADNLKIWLKPNWR